MVENDYPVPSYLADVFKMLDGWIETPEAPTDTKLKIIWSMRSIARWHVLYVVRLVSYADEEKMFSVPNRGTARR